ncbi:hypothetical protein [Serratia fonticola]
MTVKITGLNQLKKLAENVKKLDGTHNVSVPDLLTPQFLAECSAFSSAQELFDKSGFTVNSPSDFKEIPDDEWDAFIAKNTTYDSWSDMLKKAGNEWVRKQLKI